MKRIQPSADLQERELTPLLERSRTARDAGNKEDRKGKKNQGSKVKKNKGSKGKKNKGGKGSKKKGKKTKKAGEAKKKSGKAKKTSGKGKKKSEKGKKKGGKKNKKSKKGKTFNPKISEKQADAACVTEIIAKTKKYRLYTTQLKKIKTIQRNVARSQSKKTKAGTAFENATEAMKDATNSGKGCDGNPSQAPEAIAAYNTLSNCSKTAAEKCNVSLNATVDPLLKLCESNLSAAIAAYEVNY